MYPLEGLCSFLTPFMFNAHQTFVSTRLLQAKNAEEVEVVQKQAFSEGSLVEFTEKKRSHLGKILDVERKSNGAVRYSVEEYPTGKQFNIADKEVNFSIPPPTNKNQADKLLKELEHAFVLTGGGLCEKLDMTPELLEMAWEETVEATDSLTPKDLVELVHSHKADPIERYEAWRLLRSEIGHVFFKELKEQGRVVAFKAKPKKSVDASKGIFCANHDDQDDFCDAPPMAP